MLEGATAESLLAMEKRTLGTATTSNNEQHSPKALFDVVVSATVAKQGLTLSADSDVTVQFFDAFVATFDAHRSSLPGLGG